MTAAAPAGRRWTYRRVRLVLAVRFGVDRRGRVHTGAVAAAAQVHRRSVQRWLHGPDRALARLPAGRLELLLALVRPTGGVLRQEQLDLQYAHKAIGRIGRGESLAAWQRQRWLEPHLVAVLELPAVGLRQVAVTRGSDRAVRELERRGRISSRLQVPTRFHAVRLELELLRRLDGWRVVPADGTVGAGRTRTWLATAPRLRPATVAAELT